MGTLLEKITDFNNGNLFLILINQENLVTIISHNIVKTTHISASGNT